MGFDRPTGRSGRVGPRPGLKGGTVFILLRLIAGCVVLGLLFGLFMVVMGVYLASL